MIAFPAPSSSSQLRSNHRSALGLGLLALCLALGLLAVTSSVGAPAASSVGAPAAVGGETRSRNAYIMVGPGAIVFGEDSKKLEDPCNLAHQARTTIFTAVWSSVREYTHACASLPSSSLAHASASAPSSTTQLQTPRRRTGTSLSPSLA